MKTDIYENETNSINWIGTDNLPKFLREVRERDGTDYRCHVGVDQLKVALVIFRLKPDKDMCITFEADRRGLESFAGNDLLVHGKCTLSQPGITFAHYFSTFEFDQSIDRFFTWGTDLKSTLVARIMDSVFHRVIRSSVYWEPIDDSYDVLVRGCQYMEWDETCDDTIMRSVGQTRTILAENDSGDLQTYAFPNDVHAYMWARKLVADSSGSLMFIMNDENKLVLAKRDKFRAEWHPGAMFGNFKFTLNHFTRELGL